MDLPAPEWTDETYHLAGIYLQIYIPEHRLVALIPEIDGVKLHLARYRIFPGIFELPTCGFSSRTSYIFIRLVVTSAIQRGIFASQSSGL